MLKLSKREKNVLTFVLLYINSKSWEDGRRTKEESENMAVRFSKQLTLLAAPPKTEPPCIPLSKDLLVCEASSSHQNSPSIILICRSRNITGTCPASTNAMGGQPAAPTTGLRCFLQTLVSWSLSPYDAI